MKILTFMICLILGVTAIVISGYAFIFFSIAILPTLVATFIDKRISKAASNTIGAFNIIGLFPYLYDLWNSGINVSAKAQSMIVEPRVWLVIYSSAALGWIMIWGLPNLMGNFLTYRAIKKIDFYREEQMMLYEEWNINTHKTTFREYLAHHRVTHIRDEKK